MALSDPRSIYGVHSVTPYNRSTREAYGTAKVLGGSSFNMSGELVELQGGSSKFPYAIEEAALTSEISLNIREYQDWMFELFLGKKPTTSTAGTASASTMANANGESLVDSATGVASVGIKTGSEADLKFTKYVVKVVTATTVDVFAMSDIDFNSGTDKVFVDDTLKITESPLAITASGTVEIPGFGLEFTGGSGTIAMTIGDTAYFEVLPASETQTEVVIGGASDVFPEFGLVMYANKRADGSMTEIDAFRCKAAGLPIGLQEKAFSESEITAKAFYDSARNGVCKIRTVKPAA